MKIKVIPNKLWLARTPILPGLSTRCGQSLPVPEAPCLGKAWLLTGINKISFHPPTIFDLCISHRICDHKDAYIYIYIRHGNGSGLFNKWQLGTAWHSMARVQHLPGMMWKVCIRTFMVSVKYFHPTLCRREGCMAEDRQGDRDGGVRGNQAAGLGQRKME